jgi:uncharacterized protein with GYD domain
MTTFFMFGTYSAEAIKEMSIERTQQVIGEIKKLGGEVTAMHALLGEYDLLFCVSLPAVEDAIKASVALSRLTGIAFTSCPAVTVETFDRMVSDPA